MAQESKLNKEVFGLEVQNHELLGRAYRAYLANGRSVTAKAKRRGEVRGGGRKPWRQKGTGRARIGSIRAPHWRGGGVTFGPTGNENYSITIPKSAKRLAIKQALSLQNKDGIIKSISPSELKFKEAKTKLAAKFLDSQKATDLKLSLVVTDSKEEKTDRAFANIPNAKYLAATYLNVYDILNADLILISESALKPIEEWLNTKTSKEGSKTAKAKIATIKTGDAKKPTKTSLRKIPVDQLQSRAKKGGAK